LKTHNFNRNEEASRSLQSLTKTFISSTTNPPKVSGSVKPSISDSFKTTLYTFASFPSIYRNFILVLYWISFQPIPS